MIREYGSLFGKVSFCVGNLHERRYLPRKDVFPPWNLLYVIGTFPRPDLPAKLGLGDGFD